MCYTLFATCLMTSMMTYRSNPPHNRLDLSYKQSMVPSASSLDEMEIIYFSKKFHRKIQYHRRLALKKDEM